MAFPASRVGSDMQEYAEPLQRLIEQFRRLPGIGGKTAVRMAFSVLSFSEEEARDFADAIVDAKCKIKDCRICGNFSMGDVCPICADPERDRSLICVVENARDIMAFERAREYRGLYHVLGGALSPVNGITPEALHLKELVSRASTGEVREVIVATDPDVEGEATAMYIARILAPFPVKISRLAYGIPVGGNLEYTDEVTLNRALIGRRDLS